MALREKLARAAMRGLGLGVEQLSPGCNFLITAPGTSHDDVGRMLTTYMACEHVIALIKGLGVTCVVDVGANAGQYGLRLREAGYTGWIISFEPAPGPRLALEACANGDSKWIVNNCALGSRDATIDLHVTGNSVFSSILAPNNFSEQRFHGECDVVQTVTVPLRRLDSILGELTARIERPRIYLKIDTQGYDLEVFNGLGSWAANVVGMQSEVSMIPIYDGMPVMAESIAAYEAAGFTVAGMYPVNTDDAGGVIEFDCLLVRNGANARVPAPAGSAVQSLTK